MKIGRKYPKHYYEILMKYPKHYYENHNENCNEIFQAVYYENGNEIPGQYYENHNEISQALL